MISFVLVKIKQLRAIYFLRPRPLCPSQGDSLEDPRREEGIGTPSQRRLNCALRDNIK